jgi:polysaccharide biosynthesis protein PslE
MNNNQQLMLPGGGSSATFTLRDLVAVLFRHKRTAVICFIGILLGTGIAMLMNPYRASTKFLVSHERMDPVVTADPHGIEGNKDVTEEEINSEIEILKSADVGKQVVIAAGLNNRKGLSEYILGPASPEKRMEKAINALEGDLKIEPVNKSHVITVSYTSSNPKQAATVLQALATAYMDERRKVYSPPGQVEFFDQQAQQYKKDLADSEEQIKKFSEEQNGVAPNVSRDITLTKLAEFQSSLQQTRADLATTEERIHSLEKQSLTTPQRLTTSSWKQDDFQVMTNLKNTLMTLQLKRTEYLMKFQPDYPLVKEVDREIAQTEEQIATEESKPIKQETTDRNPTYAWINEELAKAKAEYSGLQAKLVATQASVERYQSDSRDLEQKGLLEQDLYRNMKSDEENYLLYLHKREQARMTEALNSAQIVNVSVAEQPVAPTIPFNSPVLIGLIGILVAGTVSLGVVFAQEYLDPSFRSPAEVPTALNVPLLAAVPYRLSEVGVNGNGNGNGSGNGNGNGYHGGGLGTHSLPDEPAVSQS